MGGWRLYALVLAVLLCCLSFVSALDVTQQHIISNSQDWRDVYGVTLFGNLYGVPSNFLVSTKHATILLYGIPTDQENILVLSNRNKPYIAGYPDILRSRGYEAPVEIRSNELNLLLAQELAKDRPQIDKYIVTDDAYGYNAISIAPFAAAGQYYVLFATRDNIDDIAAFFATRRPKELLLYGQLDREVKDALATFAPTTINKGNRFDNNVEIVKRYMEIKPTRQVILTNGEFIEQSLLSGQDPVLFLGRQNVPEQIRKYIQSSDIDVGILIGNELVGSATFVRRQLGISVFVKFAQGARVPSGAIAKVEDLDRFAMPLYDLRMEIVSAVYNKATGMLEVTYRNLVDMAIFFKSTVTLRDGTEIKIAGDQDAIFLDGREQKTVVYRATIDGEPLNLQGPDLSGDVFTVFGEGANSLENTVQKSFSVDIIEVLDAAQIIITDLYYDPVAKKFFVLIENVGDVDAYVNLELIDLIINGEPVSFGGEGVVKIPPGKRAWIPISVDLSDADIADNPQIRVRAYFGERELALVRITEATFPFRTGGGSQRYLLYGAVALVIVLILSFLATKKKCKHCGEKNPRGRKTCFKCGERF